MVVGIVTSAILWLSIQADEFAVYSVDRQRIRYLVEFSMPGDNPLPTEDRMITLSKESSSTIANNSESRSVANEGARDLYYVFELWY